MGKGIDMKNINLNNKIKTSVSQSNFDIVLLTGYENIHYIIGCDFLLSLYRPDQSVALIMTKEAGLTLLCPMEWVSTISSLTSVSNVVGYISGGNNADNLAILIEKMLKNSPGKINKIGIDLNYTSSYLFKALEKLFDCSELISCDKWIEKLRMIKTQEEINALRDVAYRTDHGINGAIHHVTVDRRTTSLTLAEELRVHTIERGIDIVGYHGATNVTAGIETKKFWSNSPKFGYSLQEDLHQGEMVRLKALTSMNGYWSNANRTMIMGEMSDRQQNYYRMLTLLRDTAVKTIRPGVKSSDVFDEVKKKADENGIPLITELNVGHGIGTAPVEPPFINGGDTTLLEENMVIVVSIFIKDDTEEIWISKDTVVITPDGCEVVGWYKDWREPYIPIASI